MRYFIAAMGLVFALALGPAAFAADGWGTQSNGYGQCSALEPEHRSTSALGASVILLKTVVEVEVRPMLHILTENRADRLG